MSDFSELIPELREWNNGLGIRAEKWILFSGRADQALGYCSLLWPDFAEYEGYVLKSPFDIERLQGWERMEGVTCQQVETAMNLCLLEGIFPEDKLPPEVKQLQVCKLAMTMTEMYSAKLAHAFPNRRFKVFVIDDKDDFGVSFHQV